MKKILLLTTIITALNFSQGFAKDLADNFSGPQVAIGFGVNSMNSTLTSGGSKMEAGSTNNFVTLEAAYLQKISNKILLGLGATYDLNKMESGKYTLDNNDSGLSSKVEDHYSIYLQPTYALNDSTSLFVKVGYHSVKSTIDDAVMQFFLLPKTTKTLNGLGYGFGITTFLNANLFVKTEIGFVDYGSTAIAAQGAYTKHELTSTSGTVSLGYKF